MITVKCINDVSKIILGQKTTFMIKSLNLGSEKVFIFVRNLGLHANDVILDFSEYSNPQEVLEKWIVEYMNSDIQVELKTLDEELSARILDYLTYWKIDNEITEYKGNYKNFVMKNFDMIDDICWFLSSSIYYSISLVTKNKVPFKFESTMVVHTFKQNVLNLFNYIKMFEVELLLKKYEICDYFIFQDQKFTNNFIKLATTSTYAILTYGQNTPQWKLFTQLMSYC